MIPPLAIDVEERDELFRRANHRFPCHSYQRVVALRESTPDVRSFLACEQCLPSCHQTSALLLDDRRVPPERSANLEVLSFNNALRPGNFASDHRIVDGFGAPVWYEALGNQIVNAIPNQQVVLEAHEKAGFSGVPLSARPTAELEVDSAAFMTVRSDHVKTTRRPQPRRGPFRLRPPAGYRSRARPCWSRW